MIANYHTHSRWCRHGEGEIEDMILSALNLGLEELAITEHVPHRDNLDTNRMAWEEFEDFNRDLDRNIEQYKGQIKVIKGFECEYYAADLDDYRMFIEKYGYFLFLGQHFYGKHPYKGELFFMDKVKTDESLQIYADTVCVGLQTGMFHFLAHPDCVLENYNNHEWNDVSEKILRQIFACCKEKDMPIEINANGWAKHRRYPCKDAFLLSKEYGLKCLLNSDAHFPDRIYNDPVKELEREVKSWGIDVMPKLVLPQ